MKPINLDALLTKKHENKWVALTEDYKKVIGYSEDFLSLRKKVGDSGVMYMKVPSSGKSYVF
jgi:hypothetical protein